MHPFIETGFFDNENKFLGLTQEHLIFSFVWHNLPIINLKIFLLLITHFNSF